MKQWTGTGAGALTAFFLCSTALHADVTAQEVWQGMADYYTDLGQSVQSAGQVMQGDTLVITDAVISSETAEGKMSATVPEIRLRELGDGRVEVTMSDEIPVQVLTKPKTGEVVDMRMTIGQSDMAMIVSGDVTNTVYDFRSARMTISIDGMDVDDADVPLTLNAALFGNTATYRMITGTTREIASQFASEKVDFEVAATDPEGKGNFSATGSMTGLSGISTASLPDGVDMSDLNAALLAGLSAEGSFTYDSGGYVMDFTDKGDSMSAQSTGAGGSLHFDMSKSGLSYGGEGKRADVSMQYSQFPVPLDFSVEQTAFNFQMPVTQSNDPQPFGLVLKLVDLSVSDALWGMFDPAAQLPRDPATLIVDLSGAAKMLVNIFDPNMAETVGQQPPGELNKLDINEIEVSVAGAELTGTGAMTFDNALGVPKPIGAIDLQLIGGNGLIDKLVAMGFVPEEQAMGARMMMGLFSTVTGEDTLSSKIEFKQDGSIHANGQRIQ
ncbi:MAG: DUF2125 domain-containing protein [Albidovulum sp.]